MAYCQRCTDYYRAMDELRERIEQLVEYTDELQAEIVRLRMFRNRCGNLAILPGDAKTDAARTLDKHQTAKEDV